ncbi:MAG: ABC transporter substrate-binding protein [Peptococcaceae bacterium]|jgi:peptide/nickel transport system substrate-binding protein|nr:ABC transporter substrate-binding protein [Peptococcaceae bacterium]
MKKMLSTILVCMLVCMLVILCLVGCGGGNAGGGANAGGNNGGENTGNTGSVAGGNTTVVIGLQSDLVTIDPGNMYEPYANMVAYAAYDFLYKVQPGSMGTPIPSVATGVEIDQTGKIYTFPIRKDVVFASGNTMTAKDIAWSINRVLNMPESNTYSSVKIVDKVVAKDDYTVVFTLNERDASFLAKLTSNAYCILDSEIVKEHGGSDHGGDTAKAWLDTTSAGSGPFIIKSWTPKEQLVLEKNPGYWGASKNIDTIILREMTSVDAQITALQNGEIDIALSLDTETAKQLEGKNNIAVATGDTALITFLVMSRDEALSKEMSNPLVQEAVRCALDYEGYLTIGGAGCAVPLNFVQKGFSGALTRDLASQGKNLDKAKALMAQAGYPNGFPITLTCGTNNSEGMEWTLVAQKVKQDLAAIGITVTIETLETTLVYEKMRNYAMPFYVMYWSPDYYDINNQFAFLPGMGDGGTAYGNRTHWERTAGNQALWDLAELIQVETDEAKRAEYAKQLQLLYAEDNPLAFLLQHPKTYAYRSDVLTNVNYNDLCKIELIEMSMTVK